MMTLLQVQMKLMGSPCPLFRTTPKVRESGAALLHLGGHFYATILLKGSDLNFKKESISFYDLVPAPKDNGLN
jgi:hypothetical protein